MTNLLITVGLLLGNAFFVGSEFALIASRRTVIEPLAAGSKRARMALSAMNQIPLMIAGAQLGITICSLGLGAIAEPAIAHLLENPIHALGMPERAVHPVAFVIALGLVVFLHTVIGEMVPKNITLAGPERSALWLGPAMLAFCVATKPLLLAMKWASARILRFWRIEATDAVKTVFTAEELAGLVSQARTEGLLGSEEHARITGALALHRRTAGDALRPWATVTTVAEDVSPASLEVLATGPGGPGFRWSSGPPAGCWASCTSRTSWGTRVWRARRRCRPTCCVRWPWCHRIAPWPTCCWRCAGSADTWCWSVTGGCRWVWSRSTTC